MRLYINAALNVSFIILSLSSFGGSTLVASALSSPSLPNGRRTTTTGAGRRPSSRPGGNTDGATSTGPKSESSRNQSRTRRSDPQREKQVFDPKKLTSEQTPNEDAAPLDLYSNSLRSDPAFIRRRSASSVVQITAVASVQVSLDDASSSDSNNDDEQCKGPAINHAHFQQLSLEDLFPNVHFSNHFFTNGAFRQAIRIAMRKDVFFTTPAYADLSPKVAAMMLDDDSSLQGTWNCIPKSLREESLASLPMRMTRLTQVLEDTLGSGAPTGDEFMMKMGSLCGKDPSAHWIDIIGVKDRIVSHSFHQDTGKSYEKISDVDTSRYTVMLGFPIEDEYTGCGVFSHAIKLENEHLAPNGHNANEPVLFEGRANDAFIIRPEFGYGREILIYRDVDVLHSAPDVVYRQSVMRFM